jgi:hypothetical protein
MSMGNRALAHVEKIVSVYEIPGADNIEMVQVLDFHVAVKKGEFSVGDLAVYVEVDSIMPDRSEFEFLRPKHFRIKAMKLSKFGIISQGILFPVSILHSTKIAFKNEVITECQDVTEVLGITRAIEDPDEDAPLTNGSKKNRKWLMRFAWYRRLFKKNSPWPEFLPSKSDEVSVQNKYGHILKQYVYPYTDVGEEHPRGLFYLTEKLEGQNALAFLRKTTSWFGLKKHAEFGVCSRNGLKKGDNPFTATMKRLSVEDKLRKINKSIVIRGEHCGPGIQGNIYKFAETKFIVFEVYDIDEKRFYSYDELIYFCKENDFEMVPVLDDNFTLPLTGKEMLNMSNGKSVYRNTLREGIVVRLKSNPAVSFKARSPEYLVKHSL